jgi:plastocyanin
MIKMANKPVYLTLGFLAVLGLIAFSSSGSFSAFAQGDQVKASITPGSSTKSTDAYQPNPINVKVGQKVQWTNDDTVMHTVTQGTPGATAPGGFDSGLTGPNALTTKGKTFEYTFDKAGEFPYYCQLHPSMVGTVVVS